MSGNILEIQYFLAWYSEVKNVLSGFSLQLRSHEVVGLIGLNGAGKITFGRPCMMKMSFDVTAKKLLGIRYERLTRTLFLDLVVFWSLHIAGLPLELGGDLGEHPLLPGRHCGGVLPLSPAPGAHRRLRLLCPARAPRGGGQSPPPRLCLALPVPLSDGPQELSGQHGGYVGRWPASCRCCWAGWRPGPSCRAALPSSP